MSLAFEPERSTSVPSFWSPLSHLETRLVSIATGIRTTGIQAIVGTIFGVIHCAAWNARFPSTTEMWKWRSCSLTLAAISILLELTFISTVTLYSQNGWKVFPIIFGTIFWVTIPMFIGARLFLIVLPVTTLRGLSHGAFVDVNWSMYIPHVGL
ncbi:hypothetical protein B0H19DRAFT_926506 [Mycena capillaripes]|nr:hypothetical protein B0H19DRAFT_926506 [Mycena capillaripes]